MTYSRNQLKALSPEALVDIIVYLDGMLCGVTRNMSNLVQKLPDVETGEEADTLLKQAMTATALVVQSGEELIACKLNPSASILN